MKRTDEHNYEGFVGLAMNLTWLNSGLELKVTNVKRQDKRHTGNPFQKIGYGTQSNHHVTLKNTDN